MFSDVIASDSDLRRFLHALPAVDDVECERRARAMSREAVQSYDRASLLDLAIRMVDLTTLEGTDTPAHVRALAARALQPDDGDAACPPVAGVCVYGDMVPAVREVLRGSAVRTVAVAGAFPSGRAVLDVKVAETRYAVASGAEEIDVVIDRGAFLDGRHLEVHDELVALRQACVRADGTRARLKVILETGELGTGTNISRASWVAMIAGADFVKTSTGKVQPAATLAVTSVLMDSVREFRERSGRQVGVKPAGGIRTTQDALDHLQLAHALLGPDWMDPEWFRLGASSLLDDLVRSRRLTGHHRAPTGNCTD